MASLAAYLGLNSGATTNWTPAYLGLNFVGAYFLLSPRLRQRSYGLDSNIHPRENLAKHGEAAVASGKISRGKLESFKRQQAAQANAVENFPLLVGALTLATVAGVDRSAVNRVGLFYTVVRVCYALAYINAEIPPLGLARGLLWWVGNIGCLWLLGKSWTGLN